MREDQFLVLKQYAEKKQIKDETKQYIIKDLTEHGYLANNQITATGLEALKPYKVENAIIMAAGMSTRFAPMSYEKPKALLNVKGEVLIEREIRQLQEAGITDITLVVGYMKEKLYYLVDKFWGGGYCCK